ncbi:hypothetical protein D3C76_809390 [compost metagenome]
MTRADTVVSHPHSKAFLGVFRIEQLANRLTYCRGDQVQILLMKGQGQRRKFHCTGVIDQAIEVHREMQLKPGTICQFLYLMPRQQVTDGYFALPRRQRVPHQHIEAVRCAILRLACPP